MGARATAAEPERRSGPPRPGGRGDPPAL